MITVKVLGSGCANCQQVEKHTLRAMQDFQGKHPKVPIELEKVTEVERFLDYDLVATPGLVINEKLRSSGHIPQPGSILAWMEQALSEG